MKRKFTSSLFIAAMMTAMNANAEVYFFSPEGAGDGDGSSWENAAPGEYLGQTVNGLAIGDEVYMMSGKYLPDINVGAWNIPEGVTIRGGYPATMKGTDTAIDYFAGFEPTVWSADLDGDGEGDNASRAFIWIFNTMVEYNGKWPEDGGFKCERHATDYAKTIISGIEIRDCYTKAGRLGTDYRGVALYAFHSNFEMDHCSFINCKADANDGKVNSNIGGVVQCTGCYAYFHDCIWRDNVTPQAGSAINIRQESNGTAADGVKSTTIIDRCEFTHNLILCEKTHGYGGTVAVADQAGTLYMCNSVLSDSECQFAGAGIRVGTGCVLYNISNTWYNFRTNHASRSSGSIISSGNNSKYYSINSVMVNPTDGLEGNFSAVWLQSENVVYDTKGYNITGSFYYTNKPDFAHHATDNVVNTNVMSNVFGTETATEVGGKMLIAPLESYRGTKLADLKAAAEAWELPTEIDVTKDIQGKARPETSIPGAYDVNAVASDNSGVDNVVADGNENAPVEYYNLQGVRVMNPANGIYVKRQGAKAVKVVL